ncbi:MAG TPA: alkaline shock response membrane anchor protein AmaP [Candidatus Omnitrophica bacterium]|nr:alkaline shock response membrane anchor protein AmaP [Candidatus Omnitrophota bacterium]
MKAYSCVMLTIATIVFLIGGIFCLVAYGRGIPSADTIANFLVDNTLWIIIGGAVFTLLGIGEIYFALKNLGRVPAVAFSNPLGEVRIAYNALEDYIRSLSEEIPEVKDVKPQVVAGREGVEIYSRVVVERDVNLPEVTSRFQDLVSKYMKDVLGIEDISSIRVYIQKISPRKKQLSGELE